MQTIRKALGFLVLVNVAVFGVFNIYNHKHQATSPPSTIIRFNTSTTTRSPPRRIFVHVLTKNRPSSLNRTLRSIGNHTDTAITIHHDGRHAPSESITTHYTRVIHSHTRGLRTAWLEACPNPTGITLILEDDVQLSPLWHAWLTQAWAQYQNRPDLAGITLQRQTLIPEHPTRQHTIVNNNLPFLYKLVGSIGFSPHPRRWVEFLKWVSAHNLNTYSAHVPHLITSEWYRVLNKKTMWTQLFIRFCYERDLYTLYITPPNGTTLAAHWREKGEHYRGGEGRDFPLAHTMTFHFPHQLQRYDWNGRTHNTATHVVFSTFRCKEQTCSRIRGFIENNTQVFWKHTSPPDFDFINMDNEHIDRNRHGVPILKSMFSLAHRLYPDAKTFTYVNGDIITDDGFFRTVRHLTAHFNTSFMLIGMRHNIKWSLNWTVPLHNLPMIINKTKPFELNAQDFFTFSRNALDWNRLKSVVIGRPAYDNWLVDQIYHNPRVTLVDGTNTITTIHQVDELGIGSWGGKKAHRKKSDLNYNIRLCRGQWDHGTMLHAAYKTIKVNDSTMILVGRPKIVILNFFNSGFLETTKSWVCNMKRFPTTLYNVTFIATDEKAYTELHLFDPKLRVTLHKTTHSAKLSYGQKAYHQLMQFRSRIILDHLLRGSTVWIVESDSIWFQDPIHDFITTNGDIVTANDGRPPERLVSGGFMLLRPTHNTFQLWQKMLATLDATLEKTRHGQNLGSSASEQLMLQHLIPSIPNLKITWLPRNVSMPGLWFDRRTPAHPKVVQNNWIIGVDRKVARAKRNSYWFIDKYDKCIL